METSPRPPQTGISNAAARRGQNRARGNILFAFGVGLALWVAYLMREILLVIYVSALFAVVLTPVIRGIMRLKIGKWRPNQGLAIALLLLGVAGATSLFFAFALPPVVRDLRSFAQGLPSRGPHVLGWFSKLPFSSRLDFGALSSKLQGSASNFVEYLFLSISGWASKLADIVTTIVLTVYFMIEGEEAYRWALSFFPRQYRLRLDTTLLRAEKRMGKWLLGQGSLMLILGVSSTIVFLLLKIRYAYALGVLMGVLNIIPFVGGLVSIALVLLVAAVDSWGKVLGALIFYLIYVQVETSYLTPRVMKNSVDLAGLAVLIALLVGSKLAGIAGAMIAVPTAVLVAVLIEEYLLQDEGATAEEARS